MNILDDFCKIKKQLFCQKNIFDYKTTLANQLYAFYCILGIERYFTDKLHFFTKALFLIWHIIGLVTPFLIVFEYTLFLEKNDLILLLHVLFLVISFILMRIFVPLLLYWYADDFKRMMNEVDSKIWDKSSSLPKLSNAIDIKSMAMNNLAFFCTFQTIFALITSLDVLLFYDEKKLKDYSYYVFPLPHIERYGNIWIFSSVNGCAFIATMMFTFEFCALFGIPIILMANCHNEVLLICHKLRHHSVRFFVCFENITNGCATSYQLRKEMESLRKSLIVGVIRYQRVVRIIKCFKRFYTTLSLITLLAIYMFSLSHVYAILTMEGAYVLKLKEISVSVSTAQVMYYFCKIGDTLHELTAMMSFEVYSMPWYCSTAIRKDVYLFLCQSQHEMNLKAAKVYPLLLTSFLRLLNSIYSTVSVLRRITS